MEYAMSENRPPIPETVKRAVRQRCGFGCVICGIPVYDYDHFEEFSIKKAHEPENIILLCPSHHAEKTRGRLPFDLVKRAAKNPINKTKEHSGKHITHFFGDNCSLDIGGNTFDFCFSDNQEYFRAIIINNKTLCGFLHDDGNLLLDLSLSDRNGTEVLKISASEMQVSVGIWDYTLVGPKLSIKSQEHDLDVELIFQNNGITISRGIFIGKTGAVVVNREHYKIFPPGMTFSGCKCDQCQIGVLIS
jgi:hypothetical protein